MGSQMTPTDNEIAQAMITWGGSFVQRLGQLYGWADEDNRRRLKAAFPEYWQKYAEYAEAHATKDKA